MHLVLRANAIDRWQMHQTIKSLRKQLDDLKYT